MEKTKFVYRLIVLYVVLMLVSAIASFLIKTPTTAAWHIVIVALFSLLTFRFSTIYKNSNGEKSKALRITSIVLIVALIVTAIVLGLPAWMVVEHIIGAIILLIVAINVFKKQTVSTDS